MNECDIYIKFEIFFRAYLPNHLESEVQASFFLKHVQL